MAENLVKKTEFAQLRKQQILSYHVKLCFVLNTTGFYYTDGYLHIRSQHGTTGSRQTPKGAQRPAPEFLKRGHLIGYQRLAKLCCSKTVLARYSCPLPLVFKKDRKLTNYSWGRARVCTM